MLNNGKTSRIYRKENIMFENGKPTVENIDTMPEDLFEAETSTAEGAETEERAEGAENVNEAEPTAEGDAENSESEKKDGITVKFNGKEVFVPSSDIAQHVQKGMNYDHIKSEHDEYSFVLDSIARENGMDRKAYLTHLQNQQRQIAVDSAVEALREKYPEMSDNALKDMAEMKIRTDAVEKQRISDAQQKANNEAQVRLWSRVFEAYPDAKVENMPKEIFDDVEAGVTPLEAYQKYLIGNLNSQLNAEKKNKNNKSTAVGSLSSDHKEGEMDPFLMGLNGKY